MVDPTTAKKIEAGSIKIHFAVDDKMGSVLVFETIKMSLPRLRKQGGVFNYMRKQKDY